MDAEMRSPVARLPIWSWFCRYARKEVPVSSEVSTGRPCVRSRNDDHVPAWKNAPRNVVASAPGAAKSA